MVSTKRWSNSSRIETIVCRKHSTKNLPVAETSSSSSSFSTTSYGSFLTTTSPLIATTMALLFVCYGDNNETNNPQCHGGGGGGRDSYYSQRRRREELETFLKKSSRKSSKDKTNLHQLPVFTSEDVAKRNGRQQQQQQQQGSSKNDNNNRNVVWMSYGGYVYDVTDFIPLHPGGIQRIGRAAGSALEPYWFLHQQHFDTEIPLEILQNLIVGRLDESDQTMIDSEVDKLQDELDKFELIVEIIVNSNDNDDDDNFKIWKKLSMKQLTMLPRTDQISQVGCPENQDIRPTTTSLFAGVLLDDLLPSGLITHEGKQQQQLQITFHAMDGEKVTIDVDDTNDDYYKNILVCYEMDGAALTQNRGFPLRIIIPASDKRKKKRRAVKWVHKITVQQQQQQIN